MTYQEFIDFNRSKDQGPYVHKHHIIPISVNGSDTPENIIKLSWIAHYYAHMLLAEENPDNKEIQTNFKRKGTLDNWLHWCYRVKFSSKKGKPLSEEHKKHISEGLKGKYCSEVTKKKMSEAKKGKPSPNKGKPMSEEQKKKIAESHKGKHWRIEDGKRVWY